MTTKAKSTRGKMKLKNFKCILSAYLILCELQQYEAHSFLSLAEENCETIWTNTKVC